MSDGRVDAVGLADELAAAGRCLDAVDMLCRLRASGDDIAIDRRLATLRRQAFADVAGGVAAPWHEPPDAPQCTAGALAEAEPDDLTASTVRGAILGCGALLVRGLLADHVERLVAGIDTAFAAKANANDGTDGGAWYYPLALEPGEARSLGRNFVAGDGALLACDSPRFLNDLLELYEQIGLRRVVGEYLGERPVLSANKCTLRHVRLRSGTDWHQDGAFLGRAIRALNVWVALSDCGRDAPGLDMIPLRLKDVLTTGTGGAIFDWSVGPAVVEGLADRAPVVRPVFRAGDTMLFDELFLHRTAIDTSMTRRRYAVESWFFAPSAYPAGQVPLVW
jgi:Phytanoyl-CoA dioxygenase (PhyH)